MDDIKSQESQQKPGFSFLSRALNVMAYPIGGLSGYMAFDTAVRSTFYGNFAKRKMFADLQEPIAKDIKKAIERATTDKTINIAEETMQIQEGYRLAVKSRIEEWGYKGSRDFWKCLHKNQKIKISAEAMSVAGITLGALILLSENIDHLRDILGGKQNSDEQSIKR